MSMVSWMSGVLLLDQIKSHILWKRIGILSIDYINKKVKTKVFTFFFFFRGPKTRIGSEPGRAGQTAVKIKNMITVNNESHMGGDLIK